ncbi:MAG TPA: thymidine phosphorylase [Brevefilum fermentans]|uniref:Pyrimidine-nucleoside phosphorylase n=1 Tax=Candidatus Brevifilum fermentans TaxID=1986204 RepID=A0A1Y6K2R2_9CHLR|nr:thymidine phosphorylase [Brevefilum fermentans]OQB85696.1 MAG: Pyrimidine-nucleoside phosphorylase [Chloroflexi bacterium ADurb.Bin120]SMX53924.1 Pyrimidine-nucleoside phosphorylase [Brevefilum fermentans]HQA29233.1 thymidine phosphorylase [Brevefilum fermentans]
MRAVDIIEKKRDGIELSRQEIEYFVRGYTNGEIPDYQAAAWAMAVLLKGMTAEETTFLTLAMANSGEKLDLSHVVDIAVDKHSSGGVGDKTSIVVVPLVRACGLPVGKMSGHGLGFSGGTLDKLESIPGFRTNLSKDEFLHQLGTLGMVLSGQSLDLAPADGKFYALRDVTGTVQSIPLIASSIMSKKIAAGAQAIVLDVKVGHGAFMKTLDEARELAALMVSIGDLSGRDVAAVLSDMNQPLGQAVGNALEMKEAILTLRGEGPADFWAHCLEISSQMLVLGKRAETIEKARAMAQEALMTGQGLEYLRRLVDVQGGDVSYVDHPEKLPQAPIESMITAPVNGYLHEVNARLVGEAAVLLGAGRSKKGEEIDLAVGISVLVKVGDYVEVGQPLFLVHARDETTLNLAAEQLSAASVIADQPKAPLPLFYGLVSSD